MKHLHVKSGQRFEVGEYRDGEATYDITLISYWKDAETQDVGGPVEIIGYYFGGYDEETTNFYIDQWIKRREDEIKTFEIAKKYLEAYRVTNEDVLEQQVIDDLNYAIDGCKVFLYERSWHLEDNMESAFKMNKTEYLRFIKIMLHQGEITKEGYDTLLEMAINYHD